ncbi:M4 family metallopeptidase, partial [Sphaerimonospora thailandensis]|uniref:M4 family metallopeptidase n=1 Tax=Sphaerimonospora thailandensis TaxID=795644 RepID=UPI001EF2D44B
MRNSGRTAAALLLSATAAIASPSAPQAAAATGAVPDQVERVMNVGVMADGRYSGRVGIDVTSTSTGDVMIDPIRPGIECLDPNGRPVVLPTGTPTEESRACVDVMYAAQKHWDMLRAWLGRTGHGYPARLASRSGTTPPSPGQMIIAYNARSGWVTAMDVLAYEYGQRIYQTSGTGGTGTGNEAQALGVSAGDIFGALTEHYANNPNDPPDYLVGEDVNLLGRGPIRNMYNPGALGDPNCYGPAIPRTEAHVAAGPQNHWFYLL